MHILTALLLAFQPAPGGPPDLAGLTFEVSGEPGVDRTRFEADNRFTDFYQGAKGKSGTYGFNEKGEMCFTYEGENDSACWSMEGPPDAEGWQTSVRVSDGLRVRVRPIIEPAVE